MAHQNQIMSVSPVILKISGRIADMQIKVTAPVNGENLPVILLSHGHGSSNFLSSYRGYAPVADFYALNGFVVIQPTHLDSKTLALDPTGPEGALFWKSRAQDMIFITENLNEVLNAVPGLSERVDKNKIAAIGHSLGGHTVSMLAGMRVADPVSGNVVSMVAPTIKAFVVFGVPGNGEDVAEWAKVHYPVLGGTDFSEMKREVLVVVGENDKAANFSLRDDWRFDAYNSSPSPKTLLTIFDSGHLLGGISGYDVAETNDENPKRIAFVMEMTLAYLLSALYPQNKSWEVAMQDLAKNDNAMGQVISK